MVQCLKKKPLDELIGIDLIKPKYFPGFGPIIDGQSILPASVKNLTEYSCNALKIKPVRTRAHSLKSNLDDNDFNRQRMMDDSTPMASPFYSNSPKPSTNSSSFPDLQEIVSKTSDEVRGEFCKLPMMIGTVATSSANLLLASDFRDEMTSLRSAQVLRTYVRNNYRFHRQKIYDILAHNYYDWDRPNDRRATERSLVELLSDGQFDAPSIQLAKLHSSCHGGASTYFFHFGSTGQDQRDKGADLGAEIHKINRQISISDPKKSNELEALNLPLNSVQFVQQPMVQNHTGFFPEGHWAELPYFFGASLVNGVDPFKFEYSQSEQQLTEHLLSYLFNFFRKGVTMSILKR